MYVQNLKYNIKGAFIFSFDFGWECVKVPMPAHQVLSLTVYIFEASYNTSATQVNKI